LHERLPDGFVVQPSNVARGTRRVPG
jgi:hypothetical protein